MGFLRGRVSGSLVCFVEQRDLEDPGIEDLFNKERLRISGTRRARSMSEAGAGIRTRPIKCEHTVTHYCFIDIDQRRCLSTSSIPWCKKVKNDQKLKSRGEGSCLKILVDLFASLETDRLVIYLFIFCFVHLIEPAHEKKGVMSRSWF